jgi:hypothetical protein
MLRNLSRSLLVLGAALLAFAPGLSAQSGGNPVRGDVDGDGRVTAADARIVADYLVGRTVPAGVDITRADVNGDGKVTAADAAIINAFAAGRDVKRFPIGTPFTPAADRIAVQCVASVKARTVSCGAPQTPGGIRALTMGGQHQYVELTSSNVQSVLNGSNYDYTFDVTLKNLIPQALGTQDGVTQDVDSIRVLFASGPTVTHGSGMIDVMDAGTATITATNQYFYGYSGPLQPGATTAPHHWHLQVPSTVDSMGFTLYVDGKVPFPNGWVDIYPPSHAPSPTLVPVDTVVAGATLQLVDTVRTPVGNPVPGQPVKWASVDTSVAKVDSLTGLVTAGHIAGVDTVVATSTSGRTGRVRIVVVAGGAASMSISSTNPQTGTAGANVTYPPAALVVDQYGNPVPGVTVRFKIASGGGKLTYNGGPLSDSVDVATGANGIATVESWKLGNTAGSNTVQATSPGLNTLTYTATGAPGTPTTLTALTAVSQVDTVASTVTAAPSVKLTDAKGNGNPGQTVTFTVTAGGGTVDNGTTSGSSVTVTTDASGVATLASWTLGITAGTNNNTVKASATGVSDVTFTATAVAAPPATMTPTSTNPQNGAVNNAVGSVPAVHVIDAYNNPVPGVTITFAVTGGNGNTTAATPATDASGNAAVGSWTLGSSGLNTLQATAATGTTTPITFTAYVPPVAGVDSSEAVGNFQLPSGVGGNVLTNDVSQNGGTITLPVTGNLTTARSGTVNLSSNGTFTYLPPAGITGRDSVQYTIQDGLFSGTAPKGWLKFRFVSKVWFVDNSSAASPDGRDTNPFTSISAAEAVAGTGETILVRTGSGTTAGGTLKDGQSVNGQNPTTPVTMTLNGSQLVTLLATGTSPTIGALTLGSGNTLQNFTNVGGITGSAFGTLTVSQVGINNPSGAALSLTNGTLSGGFTSLISGGGTNNVLLSGVSTPSTQTLGVSGNTLSGATSDAVVVTGGSGSFTFPGDVSNANSFAVNVNGKTGGTVTFSGSINPAAAARGISVTGNNSGTNTIVFSGGTKAISSAAAAGVTLTNNTGATIQFTGGGLTIATTTGTPFTATGGGTVEVTGSGNTISATGNAANAVNLSGITLGAGGMAFASISSSGTTTGSVFSATSVGNTSGSAFTAGSLTVAGTTGGGSRGLAVSGSSAPFTFTTVSVNGTGGEGIYLNGNTGAVAVNGGTVGNTSNPTGDALVVSGGSADITVAASLTKANAGRVANVGSHTAGNVTVSGALSCTGSCTGLLASGNSGGTIAFTNGTQTFTTGGNAAVTLSSNTGATLNFTGGSLAISTTSGAGFTATGGGTVNVTGANNTIVSTALSSGGGNALNVQNTSIGSSNLVFKSINATGSAYGIRLENTGSSGGLQVTGTGSTANSGGIITKNNVSAGGDSSAITLTSTANLSLKLMTVSLTVGGASGITAKNLSGTNLIERSVVDFNNVAAGSTYNSYGFVMANSSTNATITLDGVTFQNGKDGEAAATVSNMGSSVVTINVQDSNTGDGFPSKFTNLFGSGMTVGAGDDAGSTANVHLNVSNTSFTNAPANGINDLEMTVQQNASLVPNITNNTFDKVGLPLATVGVININTNTSGRLGNASEFGNIANNTISNIRSGAGPTFAYDPAGVNGYLGIRAAFDGNAGVNHKLKILNNNITALARQGILISARTNVNDVNVLIQGNTVGTAAAPVSASNRRGIEVETQSAASLKVLIQNNPSIVGSGSSGANSSLAIRAGTTNNSTGTLNATVLSNTIGSTNAGTTGRFRGETAAGTTGSSATLCLDLRNNVLESASKVFELTNNVGTINRLTSGNTGTITETGTFGSAASCTQPSF